MNQAYLAEYLKLCEEHEAAMDAYFKISAVVIAKMAPIAQGRSPDNPTYEEESACDKAWEALKDVRLRMEEVWKKMAGI
jgi:hypothetical protein